MLLPGRPACELVAGATSVDSLLEPAVALPVPPAKSTKMEFAGSAPKKINSHAYSRTQLGTKKLCISAFNHSQTAPHYQLAMDMQTAEYDS